MADVVIKGIVTAAERLDLIIISGALLSGTIVALRISGKNKFSFQNVSIDIQYFWIVCIILTIAHAYFAYVFVDRVDTLLVEKPNLASDAWKALSGNGPVIMQGLDERRTTGFLELPFGVNFQLYDMNPRDPTTILGVGFLVLLWLSLLPNPRQIRWDNPTIWLAPTFIPFLNWSLGSFWAICTMRLLS